MDSWYPEMRADKAREKKAKKAILMDAAKESVNKLSTFSLILLVMGTAVDAADTKKYATTFETVRLKTPRVIHMTSSS